MSDPAISCIKAHLEKMGYPPSVKELAVCLGVAIGTAHFRLRMLEAEGLIVRTPGIPRSIRLLEEKE